MRFLSSCRRWLGNLAKSRHATILGAVFLLIVGVGLFGPGHFAQAVNVQDYAEQLTEVMVLFITQILQSLTNVIAWLILGLIEMLIVPILQYNGFSTSPTIGLGWSLIRDVINMFVVLVLLVIAIATIVGYEKANWQKNLPQFLLAVVLVNFSRTICGILIDISQVVMFTFVNALLDVAAGNFATALGLDDFGRYAADALRDPDSGEAKPIHAMQQLGAAYLQFVLYAVICAVMLLLALVYIWRIILLWVLVILSPLTFFTWGLGGMFKFAAGSGADWWKKFTAALVMGPMLTFFLWLALATGTGDIVDAENFEVGDSAVSNTLESFETSNLLGTFLALVLLIVGMQQSAATANSMGGVAKKYLGDDKFGQKLVGGALTAPFRATRSAVTGAGRLSGYADRQIGRQFLGEDRASEWATKKAFTTAADFNRTNLVEKGGLRGAIGGVMGRGIANVGGATQEVLEHRMLAEKKAAKDRVSKFSDDQLAEHVRLIAAGQQPKLSLNAMDDVEAIKVRALTDGDFRKKLKKEVGVEQYEELMKDAVNMKDGAIKAAGGDLDKVAKARSQNVHLLKPEDMEKHIQSDKFNARDMSDEAAAHPEVMEQLKKKYIRTDNNGRDIYASDEILKGAYGESLRKAASGAGLTPSIYDEETAKEKIGKGDKKVNTLQGDTEYASDVIAASLLAGRIKVKNLTDKDFEGASGDNLVKALLQTGQQSRLDSKVEQNFLDRANKLQVAGGLDVTQTVNIDIANLGKGADPQDIFGDASAGTFDTARIERVIERQPELLGAFKDVVSGSGASAEVQDTIVRSVKQDQIKRMTEQFKNAVSQADRERIANNIDVVARAMDGYAARNKGNIPKGDKNTYKVVSKAAVIVGKRPPGTKVADMSASPDGDDDKATS